METQKADTYPLKTLIYVQKSVIHYTMRPFELLIKILRSIQIDVT